MKRQTEPKPSASTESLTPKLISRSEEVAPTSQSFNQYPKLSAAQIENRKYSVYIKNLCIKSNDKTSDETEVVKGQIKESLSKFGKITHVSIDGQKKTAIIRFTDISSAKTAF